MEKTEITPPRIVSIDGVKGVGSIQLSLSDGVKVYTFIGENGIGKTKLLESLFQILLSSHQALREISVSVSIQTLWVFSSARINNVLIEVPKNLLHNHMNLSNMHQYFQRPHNLPIIFLASQNRGFIKHIEKPIQPIGNLSERRTNYILSLYTGMQKDFSNLNMASDIEQWFIIRAQSSNEFQKKEDNRKVEIDTVLNLLNQLDQRIDASFLEITGDNRVSIKINDEKRELSHLSTGFASILKIIQSIISGYAYFTNEVKLQNVKGLVLIDEIESHLHVSWQSKIIPLLKKLFPNTTFYITTHSSIILTQLDEGEAYRLKRDKDGVVRSEEIKSPGKAAFVDVLKDAFQLDLNKMKRDRMSPGKQKKAKQKLLDLLEEGASDND